VENGSVGFYFVNSPRGRAAAEALQKGQWHAASVFTSTVPMERPNVFKVYEENIGPLTPLIADSLKDAVDEYSEEWVVDALAESVKQNKRNWKYADAILRRWKVEGRAQKQNRHNVEESRGQDVQKQVEDFLKGK
jgi:DnaD/phage-associated family protein